MDARKIRWDDLEIFLSTARGGTLARAAEALEINASTVQRRVGRLEADLGTRLFDRSQRGYVLTRAGHDLLDHVLNMEQSALRIERRVLGRDQKLEGPIRLSTVDDLAVSVLSPLLRRFHRKHPGVVVTLAIGSSFADLGRRQADIAIRFGRKPDDQDVIVKRLTQVDVAVYGSRAYFRNHRLPKSLDDLTEHSIVCGDEGMAALPMERAIRERTGPENIALRSNSLLVRLAAVRDGVGIGYLGCFMGERERSLVRTTLRIEGATQIWMVVHVDLRTNARVRALVEFIAAEFTKLQPRFVYPSSGK